MEMFGEALLKELETRELCRELYGKIRFDVFDVRSGMQQVEGFSKSVYFARTDNTMQFEVKIEIPNPLWYFSGKYLRINLVSVIELKKTKNGELAGKEEIEETAAKLTKYLVTIISRFIESRSMLTVGNTAIEGDCLADIRRVERELFLNNH